MDKKEIIKSLEGLMRRSTRLENRLDEIICDDIFCDYLLKNNELDPHYNGLHQISADLHEEIRWNIQDLIKEIDPTWDVLVYLKGVNYALQSGS